MSATNRDLRSRAQIQICHSSSDFRLLFRWSAVRRHLYQRMRAVVGGLVKARLVGLPHAAGHSGSSRCEGIGLLIARILGHHWLPAPSQQLPQHVLQNASVLVVEDLLRCVDADSSFEGLVATARASCFDSNRAPYGEFRIKSFLEPKYRVGLLASQTK